MIDNGCDQSIINLNSFLIQSFAGITYNVGGALHAMNSKSLELVNTAFTLVTLPNSSKVIFQINQAFLDRDPLQTEALLQPHQARSFGIIVDDCAKRHLSSSNKPGGQCIIIGSKQLDMHFDGWKCYFKLEKPTPSDLSRYDILKLTSSLPYEPQRRYSRRVKNKVNLDINSWRARLGFPSL